MALLQGLLALLTRSLGTLFNTLFGWAVTALFGRTSSRQRTLLSVAVGAAAAWPLLLLGMFFPKVATFAVAFIPLSSNVPSAAVRPAWIALAALVPVGIGLAVRYNIREKQPLWRDVLSGFRVTAGLSLSFLFNLVSAPVLHVATILRRYRDERIPAITDSKGYAAVGTGLEAAWKAPGIELVRVRAPFWLTVPMGILRKIGGPAFRAYLPEDPVFFRGNALEAALFPNDLLLRGRPGKVAHAAACAEEALLGLPALQTVDPAAQKLERRIKRLWLKVQETDPANRSSYASQVRSLLSDFRSAPLSLVELHTIYRELMQLGRALDDEPQLLEEPAHARRGAPLAAHQPL